MRRVTYQDDGWGVCLERAWHRLVTSDASSRLPLGDPRLLAKTGEVAVTEGGRPVTELNELERVGAAVYAKVLFTDRYCGGPRHPSVPDHREDLAQNVVCRAGPGLTDGRPRTPSVPSRGLPSPPGPGARICTRHEALLIG
ncbi:glutaminyl-peptide cyclotransferase [Streptomyces sp. NPDC051453]|uniref:glutaminyl-peptide cyclotransferase n=1 Tax=Streptomyces sp. NPDC051453 TaxID=3154941 RepID=UPI0034481340